MTITLLLIALFLSFLGHIYSLVTYVTTRSEKSLRAFIKTTMSNIMIAGACIVLFMSRPDLLFRVDVPKLLWIISGFVMVVTLWVKVKIFKRIYRNAQDPENYHINFFGKKVLHSSVVSRIELAVFFGTIPFFLMSGAYFIARLVNFFLYKHL